MCHIFSKMVSKVPIMLKLKPVLYFTVCIFSILRQNGCISSRING